MIPAKKEGETKSVVEGQATLVVVGGDRSDARGDFFGKKNMLKQTEQVRKRPRTGKYDFRATNTYMQTSNLAGNLNKMQHNKSTVAKPDQIEKQEIVLK
jgi:hypothetical protein